MHKSIIAGLLALATAVKAIDPIIVKDRHFFNSKTNEPFYMRGIDYQPGGADKVKSGVDPLTDPDICARDIKLFQELGLNTIRVYSVDPLIDHDECMSQLAAAGIYLILDVNTPLPEQHLNAGEPWTTYTPNYLNHIFTVMEVFSGYDNLLAFISGNEVVFEGDSADVSPRYVKAVVRDMKQYAANHLDRTISIGYASADVLDYRVSLPSYLECGDEETAIDWFGVNSYQWCGNAGYEGSGYDKLVKDYTDFSIPIFFTEYGCNNIRPRVFQEIGSLFDKNMTGVFSGGVLYEFTQEASDYGVVQIDKNGNAQMMGEFNNLRNSYAKAPEASVPSGTKNTPRPTKCASSYPNINGTTNLPDTLGEDMIKDGIKQGKWKKGKLAADLTKVQTATSKKITDADGNEISDKAFTVVKDGVALKATEVEGGATRTNDGTPSSTTSSSKKGAASGRLVDGVKYFAFAVSTMAIVLAL